MKLISNNYGIGNSLWTSRDFFGPVVISEENLYLVAVGSKSVGRAAGASGGLIGALIGAGVDKVIDKLQGHPEEEIETIAFRNLDADLRRMPVWGKFDHNSRVTIIQKPDVHSIKCSLFSGIRMETSVAKLIFQIGPWGLRKAKKAFDEFCWTYE
jgi:hypothetical protein